MVEIVIIFKMVIMVEMVIIFKMVIMVEMVKMVEMVIMVVMDMFIRLSMLIIIIKVMVETVIMKEVPQIFWSQEVRHLKTGRSFLTKG